MTFNLSTGLLLTSWTWLLPSQTLYLITFHLNELFVYWKGVTFKHKLNSVIQWLPIAKLLIQVNLVPNPSEMWRRQHKFTKIFTFSVPSPSILSHHFGFHIFFATAFLRVAHFFVQLDCRSSTVLCGLRSRHATLWVYWQEDKECNFYTYVALKLLTWIQPNLLLRCPLNLANL